MAITGAQVNVQFNSQGVAGVTGDLKNVSSGLSAAGKSSSSFWGTALAAGTGFLGARIFQNVASGITGFIGSTVSAGASFQKEMSAVQAVSGATGDSFNQLQQLALNIGQTTQFSATEGASALEELSKAGVSTTDILNGAATATVALAAAGGIALPDAATVMSNAMNEFQLSGDQAMSVADMLAAGAARSSTGVNELGTSLSYVGTTAHALGYSLQDTTTALTIMANAGIVGSAAGTSLNQAFQHMAKPTAGAAAEMDKLGISFTDMNGNMLPLPDIISQVATATNGMGDAQKVAALKTLFGVQGGKAMLALLGTTTPEAKAAGNTWDDYAKAVGQSGTASEQAAARMNNAAGDWKKLQSMIQTIEIVLMLALLPAIRTVLQAVTKFLGIIPAWVGEFQSLHKSLGTIPALFAALELAIGKVFGEKTMLGMLGFLTTMRNITQSIVSAVGPIVGAIVGGIGGALSFLGNHLGDVMAALGAIGIAFGAMLAWGAVTGILTAIGAAIAFLLSPIVLIVAALALLGIAYHENLFGFADAVNSVVGMVVGGISTLVGWLTQLGGYLKTVFNTGDTLSGLSKFPAALQPIIQGIGIFADTLHDLKKAFDTGGFSGLMKAIPGELADMGGAVLEVLGGLGGLIGTGLKNAFNAINWGALWSNLGDLGGALISWVQDALSGAGSAISGLGGIVKSGLDAAAHAVSNLAHTFPGFDDVLVPLAKTLAALGDVAAKVGKAVQLALTGHFSAAVSMIESALSSLGDVFTNMGQLFGALGDRMGGVFDALGKKFPFLSGMFDGLEQAARGMGAILSNVFDAAGKLLQGDFMGALKDMGGVVNGLGNVYAGVFSAILSTVASAASGLRNLLGGALDALTKKFPGLGNTITALGNILDGVLGVIQHVASAVTDLLQGNWSGMFSQLGQAFGSAFEALKGAATLIPSMLLDAFKAINWGEVGNLIKTGAIAAFGALGNLGSAITSALAPEIGAVQNAFAGGFSLDKIPFVKIGDKLLDKLGLGDLNWGQVFNGIKSATDLAQGVLKSFGTAGKNAITDLGKSIPGLSKVFTGLGNAFQGVTKIMSGSIGAVGNLLRGNWMGALKSLGLSYQGLGEIATGIGSAILGGIGAIVSGFRDLLGNAVDALKSKFSGFSDSIGSFGDILDGLLGIIQGVVNAFASLLQGDVSGFFDGIKDAGSGLLEVLKGLVTSVPNLFKDAFNAIDWSALGNLLVTGAGKAWDALKQSLSDSGMGDAISKALSDGLNAAGGIISKFASSAGTAIQNGLQAASDWVMGAFQAAWGAIADINWGDFIPNINWADWVTKVEDLGKWIADKVGDLPWETLVDKVTDLGSWIAGKISDIPWETIVSKVADLGAWLVSKISDIPWETIVSKVVDLGAWLVSKISDIPWGTIVDKVADLGMWLASKISDIPWGTIVDKVTDLGSWIVSKISDIPWATLIDKVSDLGMWIAGKVESLPWATIVDKVSDLGSWIATKISDIPWGTIVDKVSDLGAWLVSKISDIPWGTIIDKVGDLASWIVTKVGDIPWATILDKVSDLGSWIASKIGNIPWETIVDKVADLGSWLASKVSDIPWLTIVEKVAAFGADLAGKISDIPWLTLITKVAGFGADLAAKVSDIPWSTLIDKVADLGGALASAANSIPWSSLVDKVADLGGALASAANSIPWNSLIDKVTDLGGKIVGVISDIPWGTLIDKVTDLASLISGKIPTLSWPSMPSASDVAGWVKSAITSAAGGIFSGTENSQVDPTTQNQSPMPKPNTNGTSSLGTGIGDFMAGLNVPGGGGGGDLGSGVIAQLQALTASITAEVAKWPSIVQAAGTSVTATITGTFTALIGVVTGTLTATTAAITGQTSVWVSAFTGSSAQIRGVTTSTFSAVNATATSMMAATAGMIQGQFAAIVGTATSGMAQFRGAVQSGMSAAQAAFSSGAASMSGIASSLAGSLSSAGSRGGSSFASGISSGMSSAIGAVSNAIGTIIGIAGSFSLSGQGYSIGLSLGQGIESGINAMVGSIAASAANAVSAAVNAAKAAGGIASPSKIMRDQVGAMLGSGLVQGIAGSIDDVSRASASLLDSMTAPFAMPYPLTIGAAGTQRAYASSTSNPSTVPSSPSTTNNYIVLTRQELIDLFDTVDGFKVLTDSAEIKAVTGGR